jgi:NAD(P)H-flavin reductase
LNTARRKKKNTGENTYTPLKGTIKQVIEKTADVNLFRVALQQDISYVPGQFFMVSVWGAGEVPISAASHGNYSTSVEFCIRKTGFVTSAIHVLKEGDELWVRGPYGNGFPLDIAEGRDILIVAGGIGIAPLRPLIFEFSDRKKYPGKFQIIYGAKTPQDIIFLDEMALYREMGAEVMITVDNRNGKWDGRVGLVTDLLPQLMVDIRSAVSYICGPEIMIRNVTRDLSLMGMAQENIITTLEAHMKCGVGKCGHCYSGCQYICTDGPVFNYRQLKEYQMI